MIEVVAEVDARRLTIHDPADGSLIGNLAQAGPHDVDRALSSARAAARGWALRPVATRGAALHAMADALVTAADELAELNHRETGRPLDEARAGIEAGVGTLRQYAELGPLQPIPSLHGAPDSFDFTRADPRGVAVILTPWNDPVAVSAGLVGAALVTGNVVIHKPSERCPHLGQALGHVWSTTLPKDVLITLIGDGLVGERLVASAEVDVIAHVGSTATGRLIADAAFGGGAHLVLENGGNDALLIDADVDPTWAAEQAAIGAFANSGQICTSVERILVHTAIAAEFTAALVREAQLRNDRGIAPLVDQRLRDAVQRQVDAAVAAGAKVLVGGSIPAGPGAHYPATVITDCPSDVELFSDETFAPVAAIRTVPDFATGLQEAARDRYGLAATVLTGSMAHATAAATQLPVGTVKINAVFGGAPGGAAQPRRWSGHGYGYGPELLEEMTLRKVIHVGVPVLR